MILSLSGGVWLSSECTVRLSTSLVYLTLLLNLSGYLWKIIKVTYLQLTNWRTVFTTSLFVTCPTSISPISTANLRLSFIAILTTSSGCLISFKGGVVKSAIVSHWVTNRYTTYTNTVKPNPHLYKTLKIFHYMIICTNYIPPYWKML